MTRKFSRLIPKYVPPQITFAGWFFLIILLVCVIVLSLSVPRLFPAMLAFFVVSASIGKIQGRKLENRLKQRKDDSICTFTRSLNYKEIDTWIIRAVYEEVQNAINPGAKLPIRPADLLIEELKIDPEDLDEIAAVIAERAGYSMEAPEKNPYFGKVRSVEDLVLFLQNRLKSELMKTMAKNLMKR